MEVGDKLKELNMTVEEIDMMAKAFKDEKFREMLRDYAQELADPENRKMYEEEIKLLEQERGNTVEFIHPEPFRAIRTSLNGKQKCFINICGNDKVGKPECKVGTSDGGRRGQCWSLPHSLHPGRENTNTKGKKMMIYDVVFHPDTLHIASKNKRFMDMVESTAIEGIQNTFKVTLDKNNVREMTKIKYKGTPQPCVIRKPKPGHQTKEASEKPDPLAFPYPDEKRTASSLTRLTDSHTKHDTKSISFQIQPQKTKEPTKPNYTVKYRSIIDLQDFRHSRDSAQSPRPKEIVVTIDMPLLKAVTEASLEVTEKRLLLESKEPAYRLELPLAYPVDEDKGEAKFNKQKGQLTVTLPVLPSDEAVEFTLELHKSSVGEQEEESEVEKEREVQKSEEEEQGDEEKVKEEEELMNEFDESKDVENLQNMKQHEKKLGEDGCDTDSEEKEDKWEEKEVQKSDRIEEEKVKEERGSDNGLSLSSKGLSTSSVQQEEKMIIDEDDLPTEEIFPKPEQKDSKSPPVLLWETDGHGNEKVISDHSTSAGFIFENSLMFELD
ncbi:protein kintoun [Tautogolabrus adspersus]